MNKDHKVIIIGSGVGGLVTAALLSKQGLKVLVYEQNPYIGGYASSINIDDFIFDIGAQDVTFLGERGIKIATELGIKQDYLKISPHAKTIFPDYEFYWSSKEETTDFFIREFPREKKGINSLFQTMDEMYHEIDSFFVYENLLHSFDGLEKYPHMLKYSTHSAVQFLDEHIQSEKLKTLLSSFCTFYQGSPPSRLSALHFTGLLMSYFKNGAYYYPGGCSAFTNRLRGIIEKNGGTIKTNSEVKQILLENNRAVGIVSGEGEEVRGDYIVSNIDALNTLSRLIGYENLSPSFVSRLNRMQTALSRCQIFLGVKMDAGDIPFVTFLKEGYDTDREYELSIKNQPVSFRCFVPTAVDPKLAPPGCHCLSIAIVASFDEWINYYNQGESFYIEQMEKLSERILCMLEKMLPSFSRDKIIINKMITPIDLKKITLNNAGALYGWELTASQSGVRRLSFQSPIAGLYLAGQWTVPGGSVCLIFRSADIVSTAIIENIKKET